MLYKERRERTFASASGFESLNHTGVVVSRAQCPPPRHLTRLSSFLLELLGSFMKTLLFMKKIKTLALISVSE